MTKDVGILVLGLLVATVPFLGFPSDVKQYILVGSGLVIAVLAFIIRGELETDDHATESYSQNGGANKVADDVEERDERSENEGDGKQEK